MNKCQQLHETIVRDIIDVIDDVKNFDQVEWIRNRNNVGSIAKRASNLVLVFPVLCSSSINIQTASIISKAIERKCVSLLQILFSSMQLTSVDNMYDYLKQFHTNLDLRSGLTLDDFMNVMDRMANEGAIEITNMELYQAVKEDMHNINYYLSTELNPSSINDYHIRKDMYGESHIISEAKPIISADRNGITYYDYNGNVKGYRPASNRNSSSKPSNPVISFDNSNASSNGGGNGGRGGNGNGGNGNGGNGATNNAVNIGANNNQMTNNRNNARIDFEDRVNYFRYQLSVGDVQKANELMPTTMIVNFTTRNDSGDYYTTTGIIGIKAKLYPVDSMDICNRISSKYKDSNGLFNLVRASTREISFFKDLAFAIDKARVDAVNMARESNNAKMFKVLERRANRNRFSSLLKKNDASPITSLIVSQEEVEYLKKYSSVDMEKSYVTRSILENYNLMDIVIADESLEVAKFLFDDGDGIFETLAFDSLEKEAKDSSYKKVVNLMSKINR